MASSSDLPSSLRDGRYAIIGLLAEGSQGVTLDAVDKRDGRPVAVKRFQVKGARSWKDVELAEREARVLSRLSHPSLPEHVEHFEEGGALYLVMEKIEGETLASLRERRGTLTRDEVVAFLHDAAAVLAYLHSFDPPVIHRDIKPGNVIRRPDGSFALVDFGSVRDCLKPKGGSTVVGTFGYMAPEQFQARALPCSDVYSVGATAVTLLTGSEPEALPHRGLAIDVEAALGGLRDRALVAALAAMVRPDPDERPTQLAALLAEIPRPGPARQQPAGRARARQPSARAGGAGAGARRRGRGRAAPGDPFGRPHAPQPPRNYPAALPPLVALVFGLGLIIARIGVSLSLRLVVPMVLALLSLVFGRALLRAARRVRRAGRRAGETLRGVQGRVRAGRGRRRRHAGRGRTRSGHRRSSVADEGAKAKGRPPRESSSSPPRAAATGRRARSGPGPRVEVDAARGPRIAPDAADHGEQEEIREALQEVEEAFGEVEEEIERARR